MQDLIEHHCVYKTPVSVITVRIKTNKAAEMLPCLFKLIKPNRLPGTDYEPILNELKKRIEQQACDQLYLRIKFYFQILKFRLNFFSCNNFLQLVNKKRHMISSPISVPTKTFQDTRPCVISSTLFAT